MAKNLANLNDRELAHYLKAANLHWIDALNKVSKTATGGRAFRNAFIEQRAYEAVYGRAVTEAISRGIIITH